MAGEIPMVRKAHGALLPTDFGEEGKLQHPKEK